MPAIHLFNPLSNYAGGSEQRTVELFKILSEVADVSIWTHQPPHPNFFGRFPIRILDTLNSIPRGGTFVFVGAFFPVGPWMRKVRPDRVVIIHNTDEPELLRTFVRSLVELGFPEPEFLYATSMLTPSTPEFVGEVQESPIDLNRFCPIQVPDRPFTIGRMSRDVLDKHHPGDRDLYLELADAGIQVRIMGGMCLELEHPNIKLLPVESQPAELFLRSLDCFYYRTHPNWFETYGRVIFEAMATGLPVIVESRHGYIEQLKDGIDSVWVSNETEAKAQILDLQSNSYRRQSLGRQARLRVESMYDLEFTDRIQRFYCR